jgi:Gas vesicle synthesis protein GvpL/GvpF
LPLLPVVGVAAAEPPFAVTAEGLAAIVSRVEAGEYSGEAAERRMAELAWLTPRAKSHEAVVEAVMRQCAVVPAAIASLLNDEAEARAYLTENFEKLDTLLDYYHQREEWVVRLLFERQPGMAEGSAAGLRLVTPGGQGRPLAVPAAFHGSEREQRVISASHEICHALRMCSSGFATRQLAFQTPGADPVLVVGNWAFLVDHRREDDFRGLVARLGAEYRDMGFQIRLSGPWAPTSFAMAPPPELGYVIAEKLPVRQTDGALPAASGPLAQFGD